MPLNLTHYYIHFDQTVAADFGVSFVDWFKVWTKWLIRISSHFIAISDIKDIARLIQATKIVYCRHHNIIYSDKTVAADLDVLVVDQTKVWTKWLICISSPYLISRILPDLSRQPKTFMAGITILFSLIRPSPLIWTSWLSINVYGRH